MSRTDDDGEPASEEPDTGWADDPAGRRSNEPEEFDPDSLGPAVPEPPEVPEPQGSGDGANTEAVSLFWKLVLVFDIALLALAVGPMFIYFRGRVDLGLRIFFVGVVTFGYGVARYYRFRRNDDGESATDVEKDPEHNG